MPEIQSPLIRAHDKLVGLHESRHHPQVFRVDEESENGSVILYGNTKGYLDTHGTIMWHGCYEKSIPSLLLNGFMPDTHGAATGYVPTHSTLLGDFSDAEEDYVGLLLAAEFYSTPFAQDVRTQIVERAQRGKNCGASIGFSIADFITILPKDYETEIPKYSMPQYVEQNLERAQSMWCVDVCTEINLVECSLTVIPSNEASQVLEVRGKGKSRMQVTPNGILHWRSKEFEELAQKVSGLDRADQEALLAEIYNTNHSRTMISTRKRDDDDMRDDDKREMHRDAMRDLHRAHRDLEAHDKRTEEMHRDLAEHNEKRAKYMRDAKRAADKLDDLMRDDDDGGEEPDGDEPKPKKKDKRTSNPLDKYRQTAN